MRSAAVAYRRRYTERALHALSDEMLKDIGVSRLEIRHMAAGNVRAPDTRSGITH
jgi:uncharacterized protein YjiS (DUF1127 family)